MQAFVAVGLGIAVLPSLALVFMRPGLHRVRLTAPLVRHITAARLAASYRSAATGSLLSILKEITGHARNRRFRYEPYVLIFADDEPVAQP